MKMELLVIEGFADLQESAKRTWVFDGVCQVWDEDGQLIAKISYEKGMLDSPSLYYYPSGALKKQIPYHRGQIHGDEMSFDENGFILEKISYHEGKRQGDAISFFDPNHKQYEEWYEDGLLHKALYYNKEGNILSEISSGFGYKAYFTEGHLSSLVQIQQGIEKGKIELFAPSGKKIGAYSQENGQKQGEEWIYYQEGASTSSVPKLYMNWDGDLLQGEVKTWYSSGALESQREFNQNKKHGTSLAWYKNGDLMLMEEYDQNSLIKGSYFKKGDKKPVSKVENGKGTASIYSADGVFIKKISYEKGQPVIDK
jgi:antitoxin component YwqK of YwqJK toxin-antitoxin module